MLSVSRTRWRARRGRGSCGSEGHAEMAPGACPGCCVSSHAVSPPARIANLPFSTERGRWSLKEMSCWCSFPRAVIATYYKLGGLKHGHLFSPSLEAGSPKSRHQQGRLIPQAQGGSFLLFQRLVAPGISRLWPYHAHLCLHCHMAASPVCLCPEFSLLVRRPVIGYGPTLIQYGFILSHLQRPYFQRRSRSQVLGGPEFGVGRHSTQCSRSTPVFRYSDVCVSMYVHACAVLHLQLPELIKVKTCWLILLGLCFRCPSPP